MRLLRLLKKVGLPVLAVWTVVRWLLDFYGRIQSAKDFFENQSLLIKWAGLVLTSQWLPLVLFLLGVAVLVLAPVWRARKKKNELIKPKEPQPAIVAIDELKTLLYEGERLVGRFQEDPVKPTFGEVEDWKKRTRDCARQNTLASLVTAKDLLRLDKRWEQGEVIRITARFLDHGCFAYGSVEMAVFEHLWGSVERLKELIAKIESESSVEPAPPSRLNQPSDYPQVPAALMTHGVAVVPPRGSNMRPIEIRDELDDFIRSGERLVEQWNSRNDAATTSRIEHETLQWLAAVTAFVKKNLDVRHVDQLSQYKMTVKHTDRWNFSFDLAKRGIDIAVHPIAYELGYKVQILQSFRDEIR